MALRHAVMAALSTEPASGYELSKRFDQSVANFWPASSQQIYRELDRLETDGLARPQKVEQEKRPDKRVFHLTPEGEQELGDFISGATRPTVIRDDLLVKVASLNETNTALVAGAVRERLAGSREKLAMYEALRAAMLGDDAEAEWLAAGPGRKDFGVFLALKRGIAFERGNIRWAREVLAILD